MAIKYKFLKSKYQERLLQSEVFIFLGVRNGWSLWAHKCISFYSDNIFEGDIGLDITF